MRNLIFTLVLWTVCIMSADQVWATTDAGGADSTLLAPRMCNYYDGTPILGHRPRSPKVPVKIYFGQGYILCGDCLINSVLEIREESGNIIYSTIVSSNRIVLPGDLQGTYSVEFSQGEVTYVGIIVL